VTVPNVHFGPVDLVTVLPYLMLAVMLGVVLLAVPVLTWVERVTLGLVHDRLGPNRVGPRGLLQPIADGIKLFFKEDLLPANADRRLFYLAPVLAMIPPLLGAALVPIGMVRVDLGNGQTRPLPLVVADLNIGALWVLALASLQVYGLILGGWSSNNKYSLLGALRASAQTVSYELAMSTALLVAVFMSGTLNLAAIVQSQGGGIARWNFLRWFPLGLIACVVYLIAMVAETNRAPFDLPEAESELVAGFQTEYSSMKFAIFFMSEYAAMVIASCVAAALWLGGWHSPLAVLEVVPGPIWFFGKVGLLIFGYIWIRATLPRFRYDALMRFGWKQLFPIALAVLLTMAVLDTFRTDPSAKSSIPPKPEKPKPLMSGPMGSR